MKLRSSFKRLLAALLSLAVCGCLAMASLALWKWSACLKAPAKAELAAPLSLSNAKPSLGDAVKLQAEFSCDWPTRPGGVSLVPGEGTQALGPASLSLKSLSWGRAVYRLDAVLQPYRTGKTGEGSLHVSFSKPSAPPDEFDFKVPAMDVQALSVASDAKLSLAGKLEARIPLWIWLVSVFAASLLLSLVALPLWRRLSRKAPPPPPWRVALDAIAALRAKFSAEPASAASCLAELSDIVRRYLEARFQLHARTQTSAEFLAGMERGDGPLSESQRSFLKEFLAASDMVKFALASADRRLLDDALLRAEKLVRESVPVEPSAKEGGAK